MNPETIKLLRINLLRQLHAGSPGAIPLSRLLTGARLEAFEVTEKDIERELEFMCDLQPPMAEHKPEAFSAAVKRYRILPAGREWLETEGF